MIKASSSINNFHIRERSKNLNANARREIDPRGKRTQERSVARANMYVDMILRTLVTYVTYNLILQYILIRIPPHVRSNDVPLA